MPETKSRGAPPPAHEKLFAQNGPLTYDAEAHTVDLCLYSGARVARWYGYLELALEPGAADLSRVPLNQVKLLDSHNSYATRAIFGNILSVRIENGKLYGLAKFGETDEAKVAEGQVARGELTGCSVGVAMDQASFDLIETGPDGAETWRAGKWTLNEVSLCSAPADPNAGVLSAIPVPGSSMEAKAMTEKTPAATPSATPSPVPPAAAPDAAQLAVEAVAAARLRDRTIRERCAAVGLDEAFTLSLVDDLAVTPEIASGRIIDKLAAANSQRAHLAAHTPRDGLDQVETRRAAVEEALLHRFQPDTFKLSDRAREWRGMRLMEIAREILTASGVKTRGLAPMEMARLSMQTTSDLPSILANVGNKSLQAGYAAEPRTFLPFCTPNRVADFKTITSAIISEGSDLTTVNEDGEFRRGTVTDSKETYALASYGRIYAFTRQAMMNDDLGALTRLPFQFGQSGVRKENDIVWGILTANGNMADGVALFHANHGNLDSGGSSVLAVLAMATMRKKLRVQKGLDGNQTLNLLLRYIMVPAALETTLEQIMSPLLFAAQASNVTPSTFRTMTPIVEGRLDVNSTTAFYGACDPNQHPTIEYTYLEGNEGVYLETRAGFEVDGVEMKVRHDFAAKALSYRGMAKSAGA
jgi:HK97 family phage prohead protease